MVDVRFTDAIATLVNPELEIASMLYGFDDCGRGERRLRVLFWAMLPGPGSAIV
jgi:hypothetical protein